MKWTLREIRDYPEEVMPFNETLAIGEELMSRDDSILAVEEVQVNGYITPVEDAYVLHGKIEAAIQLPSTRSLTPVDVRLNISMKERYVTDEHYLDEEDVEVVTIVLDHDYIDLSSAVIDTILLNIPQRVLAPGEESEALPVGNDWEVLTQEQYEAKLREEKANTVDPRFAALKTLLDEDH